MVFSISQSRCHFGSVEAQGIFHTESSLRNTFIQSTGKYKLHTHYNENKLLRLEQTKGTALPRPPQDTSYIAWHVPKYDFRTARQAAAINFITVGLTGGIHRAQYSSVYPQVQDHRRLQGYFSLIAARWLRYPPRKPSVTYWTGFMSNMWQIVP